MNFTTQLNPSALAAGKLIGLLDANGDLNVNWFSEATSQLESTGQRLDRLVDLLHEVLGARAENPPPVFSGADWRMIQNPYTEGASPYYAVLPPKGAAQGVIGLGALLPIPADALTVEAYVYIPLFRFGPSGAQFLLDQPTEALQLGLTITAQTPFTSGSISFTGVQISAALFLSATAPAMQLNFLGLSGTSLPASYTSLSAILNQNPPEATQWLAAVLLQSSTWLDAPIGFTPLTLGGLLGAVGFIEAAPGSTPPQYTLSLNNLTSKTPQQLALNFVEYLCTAVLAGSYCNALVTLPGGGIFISTQYNFDGSINYGLQLRAELQLNNGSGAQSKTPAVNLCIGAWLSGEFDGGDTWMTRTMPPDESPPPDGIILWLATRSNTGDYSFTPGFALSSIGLDIIGSAGNPLFNIKGYTLQGIELRATLNAVDIAQPSSWTYGFATKLYELGVPLAPPVGGSAGNGSNPVAQNLLQADHGTPPAQGDHNAVNPAFGISAAWYLGGSFNIQLYDQDDNPATLVIIPVNRKLGPLECQRLGIGWVDSARQLSLLFDGGVSVGQLNVTLDGLTVNIPLATPADLSKYSLDLAGMGIAFKAGSVSIDAAFVKVPASDTQPYTEYDGAATIEAGSFALSALGSYAYLPAAAGQGGYASLFIFGVTLTPLGGPEFFFVTGLAAAFGYNRALLLPAQDAVTTFPFVAGLTNPASIGVQPDGSFSDPTAVLAKIDSVAPPQRGAYWLAAGVRFTSFDLIHTSALLSVEFGNQLQIAVLGDSWISMPPPGPQGNPPSKPFAYVEMGIEIEILPAQGVISATAILTDNSFVIDPACHLTGGFAFYLWFGNNPHAGEFVLTIGGYHPSFNPPSYYPQVPRLGFHWPVGGNVTISGDAYFALTPSCIMAGGGLQIVFSSGNLRAWFTAQMDALIVWAPFHYNLDISVSIGVSYRLHLWFVTVTLKVELDASLTLWGPSMGGVAHINWYIISFSVPFGASESHANQAIPWTSESGQGFSQTLLPPSGVLTITALSGLVTTLTNGDWVVNPSSFSFSALTSFPLTEVDVTLVTGGTEAVYSSNQPVCVRPMRATLTSSVLTITLTDNDTNQTYDLADNFNLQSSIGRTQAAKWGQPVATPEMNAILEGQLFGFQSITPKTTTLTPSGPNALTIDITTAFTPEVVDDQPPYYTTAHLPLSATAQPSGWMPRAKHKTWAAITQSLQAPATTAARTNIFNILLEQFGYDPQTNGDMNAFAKDPGVWLNGEPLIL